MNAPSQNRSYRDFHDAPWIGGIFRPLLIAVLAASALAGPLALLRGLTPWRLGYLLPLAAVCAVEGTYSTLQLGRPAWRDRRGLLFRLGEIAALFVVLRFVTWAFSSGLPGPSQVALWLRSPGSFFDAEFVVVGVLLTLAWGLAVVATSDFLDLAIQPDEVAAHESHEWNDSASQWRVFRPVPRSDILRRFVVRWAFGAIFVVFFAALSQVTVSFGDRELLKLGLAQLGLPAEVVIGLLCYLLAGLLLTSQARLALLRGHWYNQRIEIGSTVLRRWHVTSLLALTLIAGVAALLPIGSTGPLAHVLEFALFWIWRLASYLFALLMALVSLLLYPLRFLMPKTSNEEAAPLAAPRLDLPSEAATASCMPDWLGGAILWAVIVLIVGYFLLNYLRAHGLLAGRLDDLLAALRYWWRARWAGISASAQAATSAVAAAIRRRLPPAQVAHSRVKRRLGALGPRERVRYFYLRAVEHAAEQGLVRPPHRTPGEFADDLRTQWPAADEDVQELTEAFVAARYDRREIPPTVVETTQSVWRRVMNALRQKRDVRASD